MSDTKELSYQQFPGISGNLYFRDDTARESINTLNSELGSKLDSSDMATSITNTDATVATPGAVYDYTRPVVITSSSSSAPSDTRALWVYPA